MMTTATMTTIQPEELAATWKSRTPREIEAAQNGYREMVEALCERRRGRGRSAKSIKLVEVAKAILEVIQPATVRAVCYQLFIKGIIQNMSKGSTDAVSKQLVWAREQEVIPWHHIVDETREAERIASWNDPEEIINAAVRGYRKDYWAMQPNRVEVWSEKGTLRGTLAPVLNEFGVTFRVMHGYGSATSIYTVAQEDMNSDKPLTVLYAGDWDPSGLHMSVVDMPARLARYGGNITIKRIALDEIDTDEFTDLPFFQATTKAKDPRYRWFEENYGNRCWEVDALSPEVLRERIKAAILALMDVPTWNHAVKIEKAERDSMSSILSDWKRTISGRAAKYSAGGPDA